CCDGTDGGYKDTLQRCVHRARLGGVRAALRGRERHRQCARARSSRRGGVARAGARRLLLEFNLVSSGGRNESCVNAQGKAAAPEKQETNRGRSQAGQTAGEARIGGAGREEGKGEEGKSEEGK